MIDVTEPNEAQAKLLTDGMENLVGVLGNVRSGLDEQSINLAPEFSAELTLSARSNGSLK